MRGQNSSQWSAYDFSPVELPRESRKRLRPTVPLTHANDSSSSDTTHSNRVYAHSSLRRGIEEAENNDQDNQRRYVPKRTRRDDGSSNSSFPANRQTRSDSQAPGIGDVLGGFKFPEPPRSFKEEPIDEDIMQLPLRRASPGRKRRNNKDIRLGSHAENDQTNPTGQRPTHNDGRHQRSVSQGEDHVVDLTEDDGGVYSRDDSDAPFSTHPQTSNLPLNLSFQPQHSGESDDIPTATLRQFREHYNQRNTTLPPNIKTWSQFRDFAERDHHFQHPTSIVSHQSIPTNGAAHIHASSRHQNFPNNIAGSNVLAPFPEAHVTLASQGPTSSNNKSRAGTVNETRSFPAAKVSSSGGQELLQGNLQAAFSKLPDYHVSRPPTETRQRPQRLSRTIEQPARDQPVDQIPRVTDTQPFIKTEAAKALMKPSDALADLLPTQSTVGHPHLVAVWDSQLLHRVPTTQHNHLDLVDTVVSIMAKYDMKGQSAIKPFLDIKDVPHFFFLFKSRTSNWHSWSIEREFNIVTVCLSAYSFLMTQFCNCCRPTHFTDLGRFRSDLNEIIEQ